MGKKVSYDFEDVDGAYVETDKSVEYRIGRMFQLDGTTYIKVLDKRLEKMGEFDGTEYYIASPVTFALYGQVYFTLGNSLVYMPGLEEVYLGGEQ